MKASHLNPILAGIIGGIAIFYIDRSLPNLHICIITFFLVGMVISLLPPYTMYEPSKMLGRKFGDAEKMDLRIGFKALSFILSSLFTYVFLYFLLFAGIV